MLMRAFFWTVERYHALLLVVLIASYGVLVLLLLTRYYLWLPSALTIVLLLMAYFSWSWRRLSHARAGQYRFDEMSLATLLENAFEQLEPQEQAKQMPSEMFQTLPAAWESA